MSDPKATDVRQQLETALVAVADSLAAVIVQQPNEWRRLCAQELTETALRSAYRMTA